MSWDACWSTENHILIVSNFGKGYEKSVLVCFFSCVCSYMPVLWVMMKIFGFASDGIRNIIFVIKMVDLDNREKSISQYFHILGAEYINICDFHCRKCFFRIATKLFANISLKYLFVKNRFNNKYLSYKGKSFVVALWLSGVVP